MYSLNSICVCMYIYTCIYIDMYKYLHTFVYIYEEPELAKVAILLHMFISDMTPSTQM